MPDRSAPPGASGELPPAAGVPSSGVGTPSSPSSAGDRVVALWHRVRSGEDPLAFGAVVVVLALAAGLLWFWAGARHGGVAAASASPGPPARAAGRPEAGSARRPAAADQSGGPLDGTVTPPGTPPVPVSATTGPALAVHVAGAVAPPGLYRLPVGAGLALPAPGLLRSDSGAFLSAVAVLAGARAGEHLCWAGGAGWAAVLVVAAPVVILLGARLFAGGRGKGATPRSGGWQGAAAGRVRWGRRTAGLLCLGALGAVSMARSLAGLDGVPARLAAAGVEGRVTVRLAADPQGQWGVRVPGRVEGVAASGAGLGPAAGGGRRERVVAGGSGTPRGTVLGVAKGPAAERGRRLEAGESAVLVGSFRPLAAGERQWRWRHAGAAFDADDL